MAAIAALALRAASSLEETAGWAVALAAMPLVVMAVATGFQAMNGLAESMGREPLIGDPFQPHWNSDHTGVVAPGGYDGNAPALPSGRGRVVGLEAETAKATVRVANTAPR